MRISRIGVAVAMAAATVLTIGGPASAGSCTIVGTSGDDTLTGTDGPDVICALGGDDIIHALGGDDVVYGGPGDDVINGGAGADRLYGLGGADTINGGAGADRIVGGAGNDVVNGGAGDDNINGGDGNDNLSGGLGADRIFGDNGDDGVYATEFTLGGPNGGTSSETDRNVLGGGAGFDWIIGSDGNDVIYLGNDGGIGYGYGGDDRIIGPSNEGPGAFFGGSGNNTLIGLNATASRPNQDIPHDVAAGAVYFQTGYGDGNDTIYGTPNRDYIQTYGGDNRIFGRGGNDFIGAESGKIFGGDGSDTIYLGTGQVYGGKGGDLIYLYEGGIAGGGPGPDTIEGIGTLWGGNDSDVDHLIGTGPDDFCGGGSIDVFEGCERTN